MKKYTSLFVLFVLLFSFGLFVFNTTKSVHATTFSCTGSSSFGAGSIICSGSDQGLTQDRAWSLNSSCSDIYAGPSKCSYSCDTSKGYMYSYTGSTRGTCVVDPSWVNPALPPANPVPLPIPTLSGPSTAKVGDIIKFSVSLSNQVSGCPSVLTGAESALCNRNIEFIANPFYLRKTGNFGEFKVINPGTLTVTAQLGLVGQINSSQIVTLTGTGPVSTKGVKISTSKDLSGIMFDSLRTNCDKRSLDGCVYQYAGGTARNSLGVFDDSSSPAIYTAVENPGISTTSGSSLSSGPVYYSITDPLNPVINSGNSYPAAYFDKSSGQYIHAYATVSGVIYSKDGAYSTVVNGEGPKFLFAGSKRYNPESLSGAMDRYIDAFLVQFGGYTIAINNQSSSASNLTNLTGTCNQEEQGAIVDVCARSNGTQIAVSTPLSPLFPTMGAGTRIPLGDQQFIASFEGGGQCGMYMTKDCAVTGKKLVIYNLMSKTPAATLSLPGTFGATLPGGFNITDKKIGNIDYIYALSNVASGSSAGNNLLSVYKYDNSTKKLNVVAEGLSLNSGEFVASFVGVNINNVPALAVFSAAISSTGSSSLDSHGYLRVYKISDLTSKKIIDALGGTGADIVLPSTNTSAGSYTKGNSSYLYYYDTWNNNRTYVFKLDSSTITTPPTPPPTPTPPAGSGCSSAGPYNVLTGQLCPVITTVDCAVGDLFSVLTGKACPKPVTPPITTDPKDCSLVLDITSPEYASCMHDKLLNLQNQ